MASPHLRSPQPAPLTLRPGPIYAVDGDRGIGQHITYSIMEGECQPLSYFHVAPGPHPKAWAKEAPGGPTLWSREDLRPNSHAIFPGQNDGTFSIDSDSGNLTMTRSVPSPKTFLLLVKVGPLAKSPWAFLSPRLQGSPFEDLLVTAASLTPRVTRWTMPATQ